MISKIKFSNYKAFEYGEIEFRPITILLGANSVGKSSILNLILMLLQTANAKDYKSALRLNGEKIAMGEVKNIFRNRNTSIPLKISFEINQENFAGSICKSLYFDLAFVIYKLSNDRVSLTTIVAKFGKIQRDLDISRKKFKDVFTSIKPYDRKKNYDISLGYKISSEQEYNNLIDQLEQAYNLLCSLMQMGSRTLTVDYEIVPETQMFKEDSSDANILRIKSYKISFDGLCFIDLHFTKTDNKLSVKCNSNLINGKNYIDILEGNLLQHVSYDNTIFNLLNDDCLGPIRWDISSGLFVTMIASICANIQAIFKKQFQEQNIVHVSPSRAYPQRYYILDSANDIHKYNSRDGNSLAEVLKENKAVKANVNFLLKNFNLGVEVKTLYDVIHTLKIRQNELDLDLPDVGFGISQVLPVIIQSYMAKTGSLILIEQPEIHLHPKMQADLADWFIHIVNRQKEKEDPKYMLIESHSEYLLKRLRRRIGEGNISNEKVGVYFISPNLNLSGSPSVIKEEEVHSSGYFSYPPNFMDEEIEKDTISFIKQQFNL